MVDYNLKRCGYALLTGSQKHGKLIGLNSKGHKDEIVSSNLDDQKGIFWALNETSDLVRGRKLVLWTNSKSAFRQIKQKDASPKCLYDVKVARLLTQF